MATGDRLKSTKAVVATIVGFITPGVVMLTSVMQDGSDGGDAITQSEWVTAILACLLTAGVSGGAVYQTENKPKDGMAAPYPPNAVP